VAAGTIHMGEARKRQLLLRKPRKCGKTIICEKCGKIDLCEISPPSVVAGVP